MTPTRRNPIRVNASLPSVTVIGCGNWGTALTLALDDAGVSLRGIVVRKKRVADSRFAASLGVRLTRMPEAALDADVFWICTPDTTIANAAMELTRALGNTARKHPPIVFHSSGALASTELAAARRTGASVASVHPLMTFPRRSSRRSTLKRPLAGVPFALEGDPRACRAARKLVRAMAGEGFVLDAENKPLYHAFGAFASPMLVALLTAAMETAAAAGYTRQEARRRMRPIVERTIANFFADGPEKSFSGPIARGDTTTVARHLEALQRHPRLLTAYSELARFALDSLPAQNKKQIWQLLRSCEKNSKNKSASRTSRRASTA